jgi:hypothetical protein
VTAQQQDAAPGPAQPAARQTAVQQPAPPGPVGAAYPAGPLAAPGMVPVEAEAEAEPGWGAWAGRLRDPALLIGLPLAAAALLPLDTSSMRSGSAASSVIFTLAALAITLWAAPAVVARPAVTAMWAATVSRHRNTLFAAGCVLLAALDHPTRWLAAVDAGLLLAYLATVDLRAAGPVGLRQARSPVILPTAVACTALTLAASLAPVGSAATWARLAAALAVICAGVLVGAAVWARRTTVTPDPDAASQKSDGRAGRRH